MFKENYCYLFSDHFIWGCIIVYECISLLTELSPVLPLREGESEEIRRGLHHRNDLLHLADQHQVMDLQNSQKGAHAIYLPSNISLTWHENKVEFITFLLTTNVKLICLIISANQKRDFTTETCATFKWNFLICIIKCKHIKMIAFNYALIAEEQNTDRNNIKYAI